jgi:predicted small metal-binding protein
VKIFNQTDFYKENPRMGRMYAMKVNNYDVIGIIFEKMRETHSITRITNIVNDQILTSDINKKFLLTNIKPSV